MGEVVLKMLVSLCHLMKPQKVVAKKRMCCSFVSSLVRPPILTAIYLLRPCCCGQADKFVIPRDATFNSIVVPTMDTMRNEYLIHGLVAHGYHVLCTGETGTGKSVTAKKKLLFGMGEKFSSIMLNFSAQTSANQVNEAIMGLARVFVNMLELLHESCDAALALRSCTNGSRSRCSNRFRSPYFSIPSRELDVARI